jgi:bifunctional UDP-N-acetylglucosamine pyrophosphorylase / glucosamine-1-phosphate N-acetyltransferase
MTTRPMSAIVLAADGAARMRSARPKALHLLCGRPMVQYVIDALPRTLVDRIVVVVGEGADLVAKKLGETSADPRVVVVEQRDGWGSGHGALVGLEPFSDDDGDDDILVVAGDIPLAASSVMEQLVTHHRGSGAAGTVATAALGSPAAHYRVRTGRNGTIEALVELDDGSPVAGDDEAPSAPAGEASVGLYVFRRSLLAPSLRRVTADPVTGVFSLSDVVEALASTGNQVRACRLDDAADLAPVVDRIHLAHAEREIRRRTNEAWMRAGVTMLDPETDLCRRHRCARP